MLEPKPGDLPPPPPDLDPNKEAAKKPVDPNDMRPDIEPDKADRQQ